MYEGVLSAVSPKLEIALEAAHDKTKVNTKFLITQLVIVNCHLSLSLSLSLSQPATTDTVKRLVKFDFPDVVSVTSKDESNRRHGASGWYQYTHVH